MGLFSDMRGGQFKPGPGVDKPPPVSGFRRFRFILMNHPGKLVAANILFLLFSVPVITIPVSLCGLNMVCAQLMRTGKCYLVQDFLDGFKQRFLVKTLFGMPFCVVIGGTVLLYIAEMRTAGFYAAAAASCYLFMAACRFFIGIIVIGENETPSRLFLRALRSCFNGKSTLRLLPALMLAALFTIFYISLLPVMIIVGMSLIVLLAMAALPDPDR